MSGNQKIQIVVLSLALSAMLSSPAAAQGANPAPSATKIGIVNIQDAIVATNEGKKEFDVLQTKFLPKKTELDNQNSEVENLKKQYDAQKDKLSPEAGASQVKTIEAKQKLLQRNYEDAQTEFQQAESEVVNRIGSKLLTVLEAYAKNNGYSMVLDVSNPQTPVLWFDQGTNITKQLVDAYNVTNPATAPPARSNAAPATQRPAATHPATPAATPKKPQ
ncbi:MAG TPA: OmpH family outer membrane protein [Candidatus Angelobacter sp.]